MELIPFNYKFLIVPSGLNIYRNLKEKKGRTPLGVQYFMAVNDDSLITSNSLALCDSRKAGQAMTEEKVVN